MPATDPVSLYCQKTHEDHGDGTSGQLTLQLAIHRP